MDLHFTDADGSVTGAVVAGLAAIASIIGWWFHVRRLERADRVDGSVSKSLSFVLNELRTEIGRLTADNIELRARVGLLEVQNYDMASELARHEAQG